MKKKETNIRFLSLTRWWSTKPFSFSNQNTENKNTPQKTNNKDYQKRKKKEKNRQDEREKKKCNKNGFPLENAKTLRRRCWARFVIIYTPSIQNDMCNRVQRWDWKKFQFQLQSDTVWKYFLFVCEVIKKKKRKNGWWMEGRAQKINICFCKRQKKSYSTLCLFLLLFVDGSFAHFCR